MCLQEDENIQGEGVGLAGQCPKVRLTATRSFLWEAVGVSDLFAILKRSSQHRPSSNRKLTISQWPLQGNRAQAWLKSELAARIRDQKVQGPPDLSCCRDRGCLPQEDKQKSFVDS